MVDSMSSNDIEFFILNGNAIRNRVYDLGTPGMGVILWGASPLYVNSVTVVMTGT